MAKKVKMHIDTVLCMLNLVWEDSSVVTGRSAERLVDLTISYGSSSVLIDKRHAQGLIRRGFISDNGEVTDEGRKAFGAFGDEHYNRILSFIETIDEGDDYADDGHGWNTWNIVFQNQRGELIPLEWG